MSTNTILLLLYILSMLSTPSLADLFLVNLKPGGLMHWWDKYILLPLRAKDSKWGLILGGCAQCFTTWLGTLIATVIGGIYIYNNLSGWWFFALPSWMFINMGFASMLFKLFIEKFKTDGDN